MRWIDATEVAALSPMGQVATAIEQIYDEGLAVPQRGEFSINDEISFLTAPGWQSAGLLGTKLVTETADATRPGPAPQRTQGVYALFDATTGTPLAVMDAAELTTRRTAATAALANRYLARSDASTHLVIGTGRLAPFLAMACVSVRPVTRTLVYGRDSRKAASVVDNLRRLGITAQSGPELEPLVQQADIISCATSATNPVLFGNAIAPGTHINLLGSCQPHMREADDRTITRARLFVDHREDALQWAGDLTQPIAHGVIDDSAIENDLGGLVRSGEPLHRARTDITLFKSIGSAEQDFAIAELVWRRLNAGDEL